jgi:hypothetical protein
MQLQIETSNSGSRTVMNKKSVQLGGLYTRSDKYVQTVRANYDLIPRNENGGHTTGKPSIVTRMYIQFAISVSTQLQFEWNNVVYSTEEEIELKKSGSLKCRNHMVQS